MEPVNHKWTEETLKSSLHSSKRELNALKKANAQAKKKGQKVNDKSFHEQCIAIQKKIDLQTSMLESVQVEQSYNLPKFPSPKKTAFDSTGLRDFQKIDKISDIPNFYKGAHEWEFGLDTK